MALSLAPNYLFSAFLHDISDRKRHETLLMNQSEFLWNLADGVAVADETLRISYANPAFEKMFGYEAGEVTGLPVSALLAPSDFKEVPFLSVIRSALDKEGVWGGDVRALRKDRTELITRTRVSLQKNSSQVHYLSVVRDITEVRKNEEKVKTMAEQLARSNRDLELFGRTVSHDLQEPLRMVSSYLTLLKRRQAEKLDKESMEFIDFAVDGAGRMRQLICDLLDYSRVGQEKVSMGRVDCAEVLEEVLASLSLTIREAAASVVSDPLPAVFGNRSQIGQLFQNLIANGIKYHGSASPRIQISARAENGIATFSFKDNGIGIAKEYHERIFGAFQRLHRRDEYPGTGLGLATCKKIVERHGGRIWVESELGNGSTFYFTLRCPETLEEVA